MQQARGASWYRIEPPQAVDLLVAEDLARRIRRDRNARAFRQRLLDTFGAANGPLVIVDVNPGVGGELLELQECRNLRVLRVIGRESLGEVVTE